MKTNKHEQVYDKIKEMILNLDLQPNQMLAEQELSDQFQVSRTPVRQALQRLLLDRLVEYVPNKGMFVTELKIIDVLEIYRIREVLDPVALAICLVDNSAMILEEMGASLELQKKSIEDGAYMKYLKADLDFHRCYLCNCTNERLKALLIQLSDDSLRYSSYAKDDATRAKMSIVQHEAIFAAVQNRDSDAAQDATKQHMIEVREYFKRKL